MTKILCFAVLLLSQNVQASFTDSLISRFKSLIARFSGEKKTQEASTLPPIPEVGGDHKSTSVQKTKSEGRLSEEQVRQYNQLFVEEVFEATRRSKPSVNDVSQWYSVLVQGGSNEGVYRALVLDQTYRGLENLDYSSSEEVQKFANHYFNTFLNRKINEQSLSSANFYYLKKLAVEKSLELLDAYLSQEGDNVYKWYGVLSAKIAAEYPQAFKSKVRRDQDAYYHETWAQNVSDQILKSEVIVKLHKVFNHLQQ